MAAQVNTERAIALLARGISHGEVAVALGCTPSYVTQLLSQEEFADAVAQRKFLALESATQRDTALDELEDMAIRQLRKALPTVMKPMELTKILATLNGAKRRGSITQHGDGELRSAQVSLTLPTQTVKNFTVNIHNQVIGAGGQDLITATLQSVASLAQEPHHE